MHLVNFLPILQGDKLFPRETTILQGKQFFPQGKQLFYKGNNFCDYPFAFLYTVHQATYEKGSTLKGMNLLPVGTNSFLLE